MLKRLTTLPPTLQAIYEDVYYTNIGKLEDDEQAICTAIFAWLLCAYTTLKSHEFCLAVGWVVDDFELTKEQILSFTFNLVTYDEENDTFHFPHLSVREFLEGKEFYAAERNHALAAFACIRSLGAPDALGFLRSIRNVSRLSFRTEQGYSYAIVMWPYHCRNAQPHRSGEVLAPLLRELLGHSGTDCNTMFASWSHWCSQSWQRYDYSLSDFLFPYSYVACEPPNSAFVIVAFGYEEFFDHTINLKALSKNLVERHGISLLTVAALHGQLTIVRRLIDHGFDVNCSVHHDDLPSPLYAAGHFTSCSRDARWFWHESENCDTYVDEEVAQTIERLLLEHGANPNTQGGAWGTILIAAASCGREQTVNMLLAHGANVNLPSPYGAQPFIRIMDGGNTGFTAIQAACYAGHLGVVRILLDHKIKVETCPMDLDVALYRACEGAQEHIVAFLLQYGANVDTPGVAHNNHDWPALQAACGSVRGSVKVVQTLLDFGADVNMQLNVGATALQVACAQGHIEIVRLLLSRGAEINAYGDAHGTALIAACNHNHIEVVRLLLSYNDAEIDACCGGDGTALIAACVKGNTDIVHLLLDHGASPDAQEEIYGTALQAVCKEGNLELAHLLLDRGAGANIQGGRYGNALQATCVQPGQAELAKLLLDRAADINKKGGLYGNALMAACLMGSGDLKIVRLLLDHGANVNQEHRGNTVLQRACRMGELELAQLLLDYGAKVFAGGCGTDALQSAMQAETSGLDMIQLLIQRGADVDDTEKLGPALAMACSKGYHDIVNLLLAQGADVNSSVDAYYGSTPLQLACMQVDRDTGWDTGSDIAVSYPQTIEMLLRAGAEVNARRARRSALGNSALEIALELQRDTFGQRDRIVGLLVNAGARKVSKKDYDADNRRWVAVDEDGKMWLYDVPEDNVSEDYDMDASDGDETDTSS